MSRKTILVADDERHITHILSFKLKQVGVSVLAAEDGQEALSLARKHHPDLVITDFQMPVLDGFELCVQLRENAATAEIPVVLLTARGHKIPPRDLRRTNIQCIIAKPFSARELLSNIEELLGTRFIEQADPSPNPQAALL